MNQLRQSNRSEDNFIAAGSCGILCIINDEERNARYACKYFKSTDDQFEVELNLLKKLRHERIIRLVEHEVPVPLYNGEEMPHLLVEYAANGSLSQYVGNGFTCPSEVVTQNLLYQLCEGVQYLHSERVAHRDLKPCNVVLDDTFNVKIIDFGHAMAFDLNEYGSEVKTNTRAGTECYMAPEVHAGEEYEATKADIFSLGVIFIEVLTGSRPFVKPTQDDEAFSLVAQGQFEEFWARQSLPEWVSEDLKALISSMIEYFPDARPSIEDVISSDWFANMEIVPLQRYFGAFRDIVLLEESVKITASPAKEDRVDLMFTSQVKNHHIHLDMESSMGTMSTDYLSLLGKKSLEKDLFSSLECYDPEISSFESVPSREIAHREISKPKKSPLITKFRLVKSRRTSKTAKQRKAANVINQQSASLVF